MVIKHPVYSYVLAIFSGIFILFIPDIEPFPYILGFIYFICGLLFGILWPGFSWRWGLLIAGPILLFMFLSVAFAGISKIFLTDILVIIVPVSAACLGSFVGSFLKRRASAH